MVEPPPLVQDSGYTCVECGYDLSGTAIGSVCPECGRPIVESLRSRESGSKKSSLPVTAMILGILSLVLCALIGPVAWYIGAKAREEIKTGGFDASAQGMATAGWVMGIIGTVICIFYGVFLLISLAAGGF